MKIKGDDISPRQQRIDQNNNIQDSVYLQHHLSTTRKFNWKVQLFFNIRRKHFSSKLVLKLATTQSQQNADCCNTHCCWESGFCMSLLWTFSCNICTDWASELIARKVLSGPTRFMGLMLGWPGLDQRHMLNTLLDLLHAYYTAWIYWGALWNLQDASAPMDSWEGFTSCNISSRWLLSSIVSCFTPRQSKAGAVQTRESSALTKKSRFSEAFVWCVQLGILWVVESKCLQAKFLSLRYSTSHSNDGCIFLKPLCHYLKCLSCPRKMFFYRLPTEAVAFCWLDFFAQTPFSLFSLGCTWP